MTIKSMASAAKHIVTAMIYPCPFPADFGGKGICVLDANLPHVETWGYCRSALWAYRFDSSEFGELEDRARVVIGFQVSKVGEKDGISAYASLRRDKSGCTMRHGVTYARTRREQD